MHGKTGCLAKISQLAGSLSTMPDSATDLLGFGPTFAVITALHCDNRCRVGRAQQSAETVPGGFME